MADAYLEIDEYLWIDETIQGNVNVAGLVYDDLIEETFGVMHDVYTVWVDQIEETFGIAEDFNPYHLPVVNDSLVFTELQGTPLRVRQSVLNLVLTQPLLPALIASVHLDVLHGVDTYWEEVSSELQIHSTYANAVPYWWEWIYESLDIDMTEPQPLPPIILSLFFTENDLVNMRHEVEQEYFFNSKCFEEFFIWDDYAWGWDHLVESPLENTAAIQEIIGKVADDYLYLVDTPGPRVKIRPAVEEVVFIFDEGTHEKYYLLTAADTIAMMDGQVYFAAADIVAIDEILGISETATAQAVFIRLATESLVFTDLSAFVHDLIIEEGIDLGDVELSRWVFNVLTVCGFAVGDIIG